MCQNAFIAKIGSCKNASMLQIELSGHQLVKDNIIKKWSVGHFLVESTISEIWCANY